MPGANSVTSNQETLHKDLEEVVRKYARTTFLRPIANHTRDAFAEAEEFVRKFYEARNIGWGKPQPLWLGHIHTRVWMQHSPSEVVPPRCPEDDIESGVTRGMDNGDPAPAQGRDDVECGVTATRNAPRAVILDSGCGTGESTIHIARRYPNIPVIGIDKSGMRLTKAGNPAQTAGENVPPNAFWIRAELLDFWRLALERVQAGEWTIPYHAVYYPNPWPKQSEATRRFHMHPIFPTLLALGCVTELRTNWEIYAREFAKAARIVFEERAGIATKELYGTPSNCRTRNNGFPTLRFEEDKVEDDERGNRLLRLRSAQASAGTTTDAEMTIKCESFDPITPETAFERKYKEAGQELWRVLVTASP